MSFGDVATLVDLDLLEFLVELTQDGQTHLVLCAHRILDELENLVLGHGCSFLRCLDSRMYHRILVFSHFLPRGEIKITENKDSCSEVGKATSVDSIHIRLTSVLALLFIRFA